LVDDNEINLAVFCEVEDAGLGGIVDVRNLLDVDHVEGVEVEIAIVDEY
jgi:hypothetical protein